MRTRVLSGTIGSLWLAAACLTAAGQAFGKEPKMETDAAPPALQQSSTRLILLGTGGGPVARARRAQPASLVEVNGETFLIDAGDGVVRQLAAAGIAVNQVDKIFLSHLHMDHVGGLATLIAFRWVVRSDQPLEIIGPPGTRRIVDGAVAFMQLPRDIFAAQTASSPSLESMVQVTEITAGEPTVAYRDDGITVTAVENSHYQTMAGTALPAATRSYSYRIDAPDRSIVFSGDSGPSQALQELAEGVDVLVSEVIDLPTTEQIMRGRNIPAIALRLQMEHMEKEHLPQEELGKLANAANVGMVVLSHFVMGLDHETDMRLYTDGVKRHFSGPVISGNDLDQF